MDAFDRQPGDAERRDSSDEGAWSTPSPADPGASGAGPVVEILGLDRDADPEALQRAFAARCLLRYPGLIEIHGLDLTEHAGAPRLMRERIEGETFAETLARGGYDAFSAPAAELLRVLEFFHAFDRVHGRLTPDAFRVRRRPIGGARVVLHDVAGSLRPAAVPGPDELPAACLPYIAPELLDGERTPTPASDLYALGAVLFEAVHRRPPFRAKDGDRSALIDAVRAGRRARPAAPEGYPHALAAWLEELLSPDAAQRPASALQALERLNAACRTRHPTETPDGRAARLSSGPPAARDDEIRRLWCWLDRPGAPPVCRLHGPRESGKRRLLRWLAGEAAARGWVVAALTPTSSSPPAGGGFADRLARLLERARGAAQNRPTLVLVDAASGDGSGISDVIHRHVDNGQAGELRLVAALAEPAADARESAEKDGGIRIDLAPLGTDGLKAMALRATGLRTVPRDVLRQLDARCQGLAGRVARQLVDGRDDTRAASGSPGEPSGRLLERWAVDGPLRVAEESGRRLLAEAGRSEPTAVPALPGGDSAVDGRTDESDSPIVRRLLALYDVTRALNSEDDPEALLESIVDMALDVIGAERGMILLRSDETGEFGVRVARNVERRTIEDAGAFSSHVVAEAGGGRSVLALDASRAERFRSLESVSRFGIRSLMCVPLRSRGTIIGAVYLDNRTEGRLFDREDLRFLEAFADQAALALENARARAELAAENARLQSVAESRARFENIVGCSPAMQHVFDLIEKFAASDLPVLILGESGTGKELVARAIHFNGNRRKRAFVTENCAAIPESLLQSELFGHVRGAFTGADRDRAGLFEQADGGTLFLDEIGDMSPGMQAQLLRALQEGEVRRVGANRMQRVDVRVLAATHRHLADEARRGTFREDLYYRLQVLTVALPPLRERDGDLPLLVDFFLRRIARTRDRKPSRVEPEVMELFEKYRWPGNVRQLESALQRLSLLAGDGPIDVRVLESDPALSAALRGTTPRDGLPISLERSERERIAQALEASRGNRAGAARLLGISRATVYRKIKEYGL